MRIFLSYSGKRRKIDQIKGKVYVFDLDFYIFWIYLFTFSDHIYL